MKHALMYRAVLWSAWAWKLLAQAQSIKIHWAWAGSIKILWAWAGGINFTVDPAPASWI